MTDELDKLKRALQDAAPAPSEAAKLAALQLAEENFEKLQGSGEFARPTKTTAPTRPSFLRGLATMFTPKSLMLTTSTIAIFAIGYVVVEPFSTPETSVSNDPAKKAVMAEAPQVIVPEVSLQQADPGPSAATAADQPPLIAVGPVTTSPVEQDNQAATDALIGGNVASEKPSPAAPRADAEADMEREESQSETAMVAAEAEAPSNAPTTSIHREMAAQRAKQEAQQADERKRRSSGSDLAAGALALDGFSAGIAPSITRPAPPAPDPQVIEQAPSDQFANDDSNPIQVTAQSPVSTFSIDVDTTSYSWVRRSLQNGQMPSPEAVRIEEMVNYFSYAYPGPEGDAPFQTSVSVQQTPWNADTKLVHIGIQGKRPAQDSQPPLNLVFLIDTSGSMSSPDKLPLLVQSFRLMLSQLRPQDQVAIVTYAGRAGLVLEPTSASDTAKINAALGNLAAGGSTAGAAGLGQAYAVAADMMDDPSEISRVILATDGDFNVGVSSVEGMKTLVEQKRKSGTYLSVLGFGRGNLNDALMQTLAQNGNGQAAYIDTLSEARKVLVDQLGGALFPIAGDVKIQVEFNPAQVAEYRLIGYETRALAREDFNNDKVDAGDIGAGHTVTALYEVTPVGSPAIRNTPLRYQAEAEVVATSGSDELGFLRLRYKAPGEDRSQLIEAPIQNDVSAGGPEVRFATAIAGFGQLLRGGSELGDWSYSDAIALALSGKGEDSFGYRSEAITLMRLAESLAGAE